MKERQLFTADEARGVVLDEAAGDDGRSVRARLASGQELLIPRDLLELRADGAYHLSAALPAGTLASGEQRVIPVIAEELEVGTRRLERDVQIRKRVTTREELVDEALLRDDVIVERVPIGRVVQTAPRTRSEGDTMVVPVLEEVLVVEKRLMLKEEVRITLRRTSERKVERVPLRAEEVVVERDEAKEHEAGA